MRHYITIAMLLLSLNIMAQEVNTTLGKEAEEVVAPANVAEEAATIAKPMEISPVTDFKKTNIPLEQVDAEHPIDSLHLPLFNRNGQPLIGFYPYYFGGWYPWNLHKGLNLNLGASVFSQFGKNAYHGVGFAQNITAMYATPLTDKLSLAVGGYFNNVFWGHNNYHDAGISGVLSYRFDEHWEAFIYGQKSFVQKQRPMPLYDIANIGDRIGIGAAYHFSPSFTIAVSVESAKYPAVPFQHGYSLFSDPMFSPY